MVAKKKEQEVEIVEIQQDRIEFCVLGRSPLLLLKMSQKALHELLLPRGRKSAADKANSLKHEPYREFRDAPYQVPDGPTLIAMPSVAFKKALAAVAVDIPGAAKAQISRLCHCEGQWTHIYGVPRMHMSVVRSADMNRTPDVRTRCVIPEWAAHVVMTYTRPLLTHTTIARLFAAAGVVNGVGEWRPQKGSGTYGQFDLVDPSDKRFKELIKKGGRDVQVKAMDNPLPFDDETAELYSWYTDEIHRRGVKGVDGITNEEHAE